MYMFTWKYGDIKLLSTKTSIPYKQNPNILTILFQFLRKIYNDDRTFTNLAKIFGQTE